MALFFYIVHSLESIKAKQLKPLRDYVVSPSPPDQCSILLRCAGFTTVSVISPNIRRQWIFTVQRNLTSVSLSFAESSKEHLSRKKLQNCNPFYEVAGEHLIFYIQLSQLRLNKPRVFFHICSTWILLLQLVLGFNPNHVRVDV